MFRRCSEFHMPHTITMRQAAGEDPDGGGPRARWRVVTGCLSRDRKPSRQNQREQVAADTVTDSLLPKTRHFTYSSCLSGCCSIPSPSRSVLKRTGRHSVARRVRCKRSQQKLFAAGWCGLAGRRRRNGQQRAGSRGIGKPSRAQRVGSTCWKCRKAVGNA